MQTIIVKEPDKPALVSAIHEDPLDRYRQILEGIREDASIMARTASPNVAQGGIFRRLDVLGNSVHSEWLKGWRLAHPKENYDPHGKDEDYFRFPGDEPYSSLFGQIDDLRREFRETIGGQA